MSDLIKKPISKSRGKKIEVKTSAKNIVVLPDIRSAYNIGSIFRTCDAVGIDEIVLSGCTPRPLDKFNRVQKEIAKTALGAEKNIPWVYEENSKKAVQKLKKQGFYIIGVECKDAVLKNKIKVPVVDYKRIDIVATKGVVGESANKNKGAHSVAFVFGNEVDGIAKDIMSLCDVIADIKMKGNKESLNVSVSAGIVLYGILRV